MMTTDISRRAAPRMGMAKMADGDWFEPRNEREEDIIRVARSQCVEVARCGRYPVAPINWNEHRETFATLAEYRTHDFAVKLTFDDVDDGYQVELAYRRWYGTRRVTLSASGRDAALAMLDKCVIRHPFRPFVCHVDY